MRVQSRRLTFCPGSEAVVLGHWEGSAREVSMRKAGKVLLVILGILVVQQILDTLLMMWAMRTHDPRAVRLYMRSLRFSNPLVIRFAGRSGSHLATVHHVGRRSGTSYATPVMSLRDGDSVVVPLPWGTEVDWLRNLRAAGEGVVDLDGRHLMVEDPEVVPMDEVIGRFPPSLARIVRSHRTREAVQMRVSGIAAPASA